MTQERYGGWIQTYTGIAFYPMDPRWSEIDHQDIAHALGMLCRFAGHTEEFYSIGEHCCHIADWLLENAPEAALGGLMHDSSEAYLVDIPKPVKNHLSQYVLIEKHLEKTIFDKYSIPFPFHPKIKEADSRILIDERNALLKPPVKAWDFEPEPLGIKIEGWSPKRAKAEFLDRFHTLYEQKEKYVESIA